MRQEELSKENGVNDPRYKLAYGPMMSSMLKSLSSKFDQEFNSSLATLTDKYYKDGKLTHTDSKIK